MLFEFDECDCPFVNPLTGQKLVNFWGYNPIAFSASKASFAASADSRGQDNEFRDLVKACHAAGIEVILDVVFNHTGEGDDRGRTFSFRGLDNELYYMLDDDGRFGVRVMQEDGSTKFTAVTMIAQERDGAWVTGLPGQARIVTVGQDYVKDGEKVEAVDDVAELKP